MTLRGFISRELSNYMTAVQAAGFYKKLELILTKQNMGQEKEETRKTNYITRLEEERVELSTKVTDLEELCEGLRKSIEELTHENQSLRSNSRPILHPTEDREEGSE